MDQRIMYPATEQVNEKTREIDQLTTQEMLSLINEEDKRVPAAVARELPAITAAVEGVAQRLKDGGRLFYIGAGTSGRLGVLDASECPPTYGTHPEMVQGIIAGGQEAMFRAIEGAEDNEAMGRETIHKYRITQRDAVVGIAASGRTPFVLGAVTEARTLGALTVGIANNAPCRLGEAAEITILPQVGPEVITGSTRMKAGTAQKLVLNMISTGVMIRLGKVYGNLMVDVKPTNGKLLDRAVRIIMLAARINRQQAEIYLEQANYHAKTAIVMAETGLPVVKAQTLLEQADGYITRALKNFEKNHGRFADGDSSV